MPVSNLEDHLGYWLRMVSNQVSHAFAAKVEARGVTVAEWVVLRKLLDHKEAAPHRIASDLGQTRGAVSKLIDRLAAKKLVSRRPDKTDLRAQRIALTAKGRVLVPQLAADADRNDAEFFGRLDASDRKKLFRTLRGLASALDASTSPID
jgi:DNA-binding MarR family transcriptional regulator